MKQKNVFKLISTQKVKKCLSNEYVVSIHAIKLFQGAIANILLFKTQMLPSNGNQ